MEIILIQGPGASGKTFVAEAMSIAYERMGISHAVAYPGSEWEAKKAIKNAAGKEYLILATNTRLNCAEDAWQTITISNGRSLLETR